MRWLVLSASFCLACSGEGDPQAQLLLVIDIDAPVIGQIAGEPALSSDAAVDTVRIDAVAADGSIYDQREFVAPALLDWPISLGIASRGSSVRLRIRAFRGVWAAPDSTGGLLEPLREVTIDRVVDASPPEEGVSMVRVLLSLDCLGRSASFLDPPGTCIDAARLDALPSEGLEPIEESPTDTRAGSAPPAREQPCAGPGPGADALCIPGGFTVLGDRSLVGIQDVLVLDPYPLRPVQLSPYWLDRTEVTVGRFRPLSAMLTGAPPILKDLSDPLARDCSWLGPDDASHDTFALTCITRETAAEICAFLGGRLPSEAEWEHAARGRGQRRRYPWGDQPVKCCMTSAARFTGPCSYFGPEPVGSHQPSDDCGGIGDASRDGVLDLGGGVVEFMRDDFARYGEGCWGWEGVALDPVCNDAQGGPSARGASWEAPLAQTTPALRKLGVHGPGQGFRCAYSDGGS
jgi:formylglycine-generating enzyme required for sulfatase activity